MILHVESQIIKDHNVITMTELQAIFIQVYIFLYRVIYNIVFCVFSA